VGHYLPGPYTVLRTHTGPAMGHTRSSGRPGPSLNQAIHGPQANLGRLLTSALAHGASEGICFTHGQKFAPPGVRTHNMWGAAGVF
jgi:hypothetical protein